MSNIRSAPKEVFERIRPKKAINAIEKSRPLAGFFRVGGIITE
jgi:hypothetical protein